MDKLLLIVNPVSGRGQNNDIDKIISILKNKFDVTKIETERPGHCKDIVTKTGPNYDLIVIKGGDGTFNEAINGLMLLKKKPIISLIASGTTNELSTALQLPIKDSLASLEVINQGNLFSNDIGKINNRFFTYTAAFGIFTDATYKTPQWLKKRLGLGSYFIVGIKNVRKFRPLQIEIDSAEYKDKGEYIFGSISNATTIGSLVKFNRDEISLNDGKFEVTLAKKPKSLKAWIKLLSSVPSGDYVKDPNIIRFKTKQISFGCPISPIQWTIDGEESDSGNNWEIKVISKAYNIIIP